MENSVKKNPLLEDRLKYQPKIPKLLGDLNKIDIQEDGKKGASDLHAFFPETCENRFLRLSSGEKRKGKKVNVGVVFSGGQAPGGHNVVAGLLDGLKKIHSESRLLGFLGGPSGIIEDKKKEITSDVMHGYLNTGGFDLLGSGRTKIETEEQFKSALQTVLKNDLDGLVIIGGDDSNTNAALLAEFFLKNNAKTKVVGVPKTIDGDLQGPNLEISFGFDTACKVYSEMIGNIARDALSAKKYYHFIKLMGRSASHITLECALATHPNLALIGEEIAAKKMGLAQVVSEIADLVYKRALEGKNYGVILIPEGLIEFIAEIKVLIREINWQLAQEPKTNVVSKLSPEAKKTFELFPKEIQDQLLLERDSHGNVQVSQIATEQLLIHLVRKELKQRGDYKGKFYPLNHFLGYEGRSAFPSNFDANYCYSLGLVAALLVERGFTGYMAAVYDLKRPTQDWKAAGIPLTSMIHMEERKGKQKAVIKKSLVDIAKAPFVQFKHLREELMIHDDYRYPGPIQFHGPEALTDTIPLVVSLEKEFVRL